MFNDGCRIWSRKCLSGAPGYVFDTFTIDEKVKNIEIPSNQTKGIIKTKYPKDKTLK